MARQRELWASISEREQRRQRAASQQQAFRAAEAAAAAPQPQPHPHPPPPAPPLPWPPLLDGVTSLNGICCKILRAPWSPGNRSAQYTASSSSWLLAPLLAHSMLNGNRWPDFPATREPFASWIPGIQIALRVCAGYPGVPAHAYRRVVARPTGEATWHAQMPCNVPSFQELAQGGDYLSPHAQESLLAHVGHVLPSLEGSIMSYAGVASQTAVSVANGQSDGEFHPTLANSLTSFGVAWDCAEVGRPPCSDLLAATT
jgi:hypothetical protein